MASKPWRAMKAIFYSPHIKIKGVESLKAAHARVNRFMAKVSRRHKGETVVFVSHSGIGRVITGVARNMPIEKIRSVPRLKNTGIRYLKVG